MPRGGVRGLTSSLAAAPNSGSTHFDYLVIGGGSGGIASARRAAQWGAKVAVVEKVELGGTCVNVGCVPKKIMFNAALVNEMMHAAKHYGYTGVVEGSGFDWATLKAARDKYVARLNGIYGNNLANSGVALIKGDASFTGPKQVEVSGVAQR
jgi:glutathione reductase (NADPH)